MSSGTPKRPPGIRQVAARAGVSVTTVSHVLNGKGSFPEATRERVLAAVADLGYRPHPAARSLGGGRAQVIALAFSTLPEVPFLLTDIEYNSRVIQAATERALARDYALVIGPPTPHSDVWFRIPLDGVVVIDPVRGDTVTEQLRSRGMPMVVAGRDPNGVFDDACVDNDAAGLVHMALDHLWERGARRPALALYPLMDAFSADTEAEYRRWCAERGVEPLVWSAPPAWKHSLRDAASELLLGADRPDAVLAMEDDIGLEVAAACVDSGLRMPDDVKVIAVADRVTFPGVPLTTIELNPEATAAAAVDLLIDLVEDAASVTQRTVTIPVRLVQRASS